MTKRWTAATAAALALAGSGMWAGMASAQAAPAVTLTGSTIQAVAGSNVTYTAQAAGISNPEYQFWVEEPNGQWVDSQNYSTRSTFVLHDVQPGNYLVVADVMTAPEIQAGQWGRATSSPTDGVFVGSTVRLSLPTSNPAAGTTVTATVSAANIYDPLYQFWWETPDGVWHQSGNYSSSNAFTIPALTEQGNFQVIAYAKSPLAVNNQEGALFSNAVTAYTGSLLNGISLTPDFAPRAVPVDTPEIVRFIVRSGDAVVPDAWVRFSATGTILTGGGWMLAGEPGMYGVSNSSGVVEVEIDAEQAGVSGTIIARYTTPTGTVVTGETPTITAVTP
jgi:hypothetical protein